MSLSVGLFDYELPEELIAQYPASRREASRMMVVDRITGKCEIRTFSDIVDYLNPGDGLIFNNTRVMNARIYGVKNGAPDGAKVELLLLENNPQEQRRWKAMLRPAKRVQPGAKVKLLTKDNELNTADDWVTVREKLGGGEAIIEFNSADNARLQLLYGHIPLPPYIKRGDEIGDFERYQTVFAREPGAVAAPTAGLHFSSEILEALALQGVTQAAVTLHVGPGTFKPVAVDRVDKHKMHAENFTLPPKTAELINSIHANGKKILAVGTTSVRTLESCADDAGKVHPRQGSTNIFLHPPYQPKSVDMLLTNFHLPKSTLLMLVSTFASREIIMSAYQQAIQAQMRFYSYGDCMLLK